MPPTLNVNPTLFVIPYKNFGGIIELQCWNYCHLPSDISIQISIIHDNVSSQTAHVEKVWFWPTDDLIHIRKVTTVP